MFHQLALMAVLTTMTVTNAVAQGRSSSNSSSESDESQSHVTVIESSENSAGDGPGVSPNRTEKLAVLKLSGKGEFQVQKNAVVLERVYDSKNIVLVKMKVPLTKYKSVTSGKVYAVPTTSTYVDEQTGKVITTRKHEYKKIMWCELEPCLQSTEFLLASCYGQDDAKCKTSYGTVEIDFLRIKKLNIGESERFILKAIQRKVGSKKIDFSMYNYQTKENYLLVYTTDVFGVDKLVVYPESERIRVEKREAGNSENRKSSAEEVKGRDIVDIETASSVGEKTEYVDVPVRVGESGSTVYSEGNPGSVSSSSSSTSSTTSSTGSGNSNASRYEELCLDELNNVKSKKTSVLGEGQKTIETTIQTTKTSSSSSRGNDDSRMYYKKIGTSLTSSACEPRRELLLNESLAGQKGVLPNQIIDQRFRIIRG